MKFFFSMALPLFVAFAMAHDGLHHHRVGASDQEKQITFFKNRIEKQPLDFVSWHKLGELYLTKAHATAQHHDFQIAFETFEKVLELQPQHFGAMISRAYAASGQHRFKQALELAQEAAIFHHQALETKLLFADLYFALGQYTEAEAFVRSIPEAEQGFAYLVRQAQLAEVRGAILQAQQFYEQSLARLSDTDGAHEKKAWVYTMLGDLAIHQNDANMARNHFNHAIELQKTHYYPHWKLGVLHQQQGNMQKALSYLAKAKDLAGNRTGVWISYGEALAANQNITEASEWLQKAKAHLDHEISSGDEGHLRELGLLLLKDKATQAAGLAYLQKDFFKVRHDWESRLWLAWAMHVNGDFQAAAKLAEQVLALGIERADVTLRAALIYDGAGRTFQAAQMFARGLKYASLVDADLVAEANQRLTYLRNHPEVIRSQFMVKQQDPEEKE